MPSSNPTESCPQGQIASGRSAIRFALQYTAVGLTAIGAFHVFLVAMPNMAYGSPVSCIAAASLVVLGSALAIFFQFRRIARRVEAARSMELAAIERADALVRAIPQTLIEVDSGGGIRAFRSRGPGGSLASTESLLGLTLEDLLPAQSLSRAMDAVHEAISRGNVSEFHCVRSGHGNEGRLEVYCSPTGQDSAILVLNEMTADAVQDENNEKPWYGDACLANLGQRQEIKNGWFYQRVMKNRGPSRAWPAAFAKCWIHS